jgi:hypothetical protein
VNHFDMIQQLCLLQHLVPSVTPADGLQAYVQCITCGHGTLSTSLLCHAESRQPSLMLHYSGYGFASNGIPQALIRTLAQWRKGSADRRLLVVFHELFARQPPWRKGFWLAPLQRRLLRRLIALCDGGISTLELHSNWLRRNGLEPFATLPVPSNVGESSDPHPLVARLPSLVIFGGRSQRQMAYAALSRQPELLQRLAINCIEDVGPPLALPETLAHLPIRRHGLLPQADVAALLSRSQLAAVSYPLLFLAKSGIFAALCAHGTLPLVLNARQPASARADGLQAGVSFATPDWLRQQPTPAVALAAGQTIASAAWRWYQPHRLAEQRRLFATWVASIT